MKRKSKNQSIGEKFEKLIRYYAIPVSLNKKDVLDTILEKIDRKEKTIQINTRRVSSFIIPSIPAAATVLLLLSLYFFNARNTIQVSENETASFRLPDNSRIVLQDNSKIKYKKYFWNRQVILEGTAYFEVEKGNEFIVKTGAGNVEVLGTRFLVSEKNSLLSVTCFEGQVKTSTSLGSFVVNRGKRISVNGKTEKKEAAADDREFPDFAIFNMSFSNKSLLAVTSELEKFFDVRIDISNVPGRSFSGSIQTGKLESSLQILCESMQLNYRFKENNRVIIYK